ncbi:hypothetical protein LEMLEM_LOCUS20878, partial [Lemmus lemmus]
ICSWDCRDADESGLNPANCVKSLASLPAHRPLRPSPPNTFSPGVPRAAGSGAPVAMAPCWSPSHLCLQRLFSPISREHTVPPNYPFMSR